MGWGLDIIIGVRQQGLLNAMRETGIEESDIVTLAEALDQDPRPTSASSFGPNVARWLGRMVAKAAEGTLNVGVAVASSVLSDALKKYYGIT